MAGETRSPLTLARHTLDVADLLAELEAGERQPTAQERTVLGAWMGWGPVAPAFSPQAEGSWSEIGARLRLSLTPEELAAGEAATPTSFFTDPRLAGALWHLATSLGFTGGRVLETGCGSGHVMAAAPTDLPVRWTGIERDSLSARIARARFPGAEVITAPLETVPLPEGGFDLAVGNVPFADVRIHDRETPVPLSLHNYCLWRSLHALHPGGLCVALTSRYTLDASDPKQRGTLAVLADLVGVIRLPSGALGASGTRAVADIVVLRRRADDERQRGAAWQRVVPLPRLADAGFGGEEAMNEYLVAHPEHVVGTPAVDRGLYRPELVVRPPDDIDAALDDAVSSVCTAAQAQGLGYAGRVREDAGVVLADAEGRAEGSFHVVGGEVQQVRAGRLSRVTSGQEELRALIGLRDTTLRLLSAESDLDAPDGQLAPLRAELNWRYDRYVRRWGPLNRATVIEGKPDPETGQRTISRRRPRMGGFRQDPDYVAVLALELYDDHTGQASKAPIFTQRVHRRAVRPERADTPAEALALCLDAVGRLDLDVVGRLLDVPVAAVPAALGDLAYEDPVTQEWTTAQEYLSGDVRAALRIARAAAERDPHRWQRNVDALEAVVPRDLGPHEIRVRLGAPWVDAADVAQFCEETLGHAPQITHEKLTASWTVRTDAWHTTSPAATIEFGTGRVHAYRLVELACNGSLPVVYDEVEEGVRVKNVAETLAATEKLRELDARFATWLWESPERTDRLAERYNARYNSIVPRTFDGAHLRFPGLADGWDLYPWQRDIVWRMASSPSALCAHPVGAGKTASMVCGAMTLRRLGLATKPLIITPAHLLEQVARDAKRLYPGAKVLMVSKEDMTPERRKLVAARCATGDWDLVVMTHSGFGLIPVAPETEDAFLEEQITAYRRAMGQDADEQGRSVTVKNLAKAIDRMRQRQAALRDKRSDTGSVTWEQLGVDYVMVDEAHLFKSLPVPSRMTGFSLPESKRAVDLALKLKWTREHNGGARWGAFFTGTPVSNTLAELYILQLYLNPDRLAQLDLLSFDAWAALFIDWVTRVEIAPDGGSYRMHTRRARFMNCPELRRLFSEFADVRPKASFATGAPELRIRTITVPPTDGQRWVVARLVERADALRAGRPEQPDPGRPDLDDNMLWVCGDGRKAAVDLELLGYPMAQPPKVAAVAREVLTRWIASLDHPDGPNFQIVFCDLGTPKQGGSSQVYGKVRDLLVRAGMPASAIRFIHHATSDAARAQLFADCRAGRVAVLLGSTPKLGTGVNVQDRCAAVHHVDAPWKPAEVEQRDGRGPRVGNRHAVVESLRYVTPGTFDGYSWQTLERKATFVAQLLEGSGDAREIEDLGDGVLSYAEVKAAATGDPRVLELVEVQAEISRLRGLAGAHTRGQRRAELDAARSRDAAGEATRRAGVLTRIAARAEEAGPGWMSPVGRRVADRPAIAASLCGLLEAAVNGGQQRIELGRWAGSPLTARILPAAVGERDLRPQLVLDLGGVTTRVPVGALVPAQHWRLVTTLEELVAGAPDRAQVEEDRAAASLARATELDGLRQRTFEHAGALAAAVARKAELDAALQAAAEQADAGPTRRLEWVMPEELRVGAEAMPLDLPHVVVPDRIAAMLAGKEEHVPSQPLRPREPVTLPVVAAEVSELAVAPPPRIPEPAAWRGHGEQGELDLDVVGLMRARQDESISLPLSAAWAAISPTPPYVQDTIDFGELSAAVVRHTAPRHRRRRSARPPITIQHDAAQDVLFDIGGAASPPAQPAAPRARPGRGVS